MLENFLVIRVLKVYFDTERMLGKLLLAFGLSLAVCQADPLYEILDDDISDLKVCKVAFEEGSVSCRKIDIDFDVLDDEEGFEVPETGVTLTFAGISGDYKTEISLEFKNEETMDEATITISKARTPSRGKRSKRGKGLPVSIFADIHVGDFDFSIEMCGRDCFVLIEKPMENFIDEQDASEESMQLPEPELNMSSARSLQQDRANHVVTVRIYYTSQVLSALGWNTLNSKINTAFSEANQAFVNSGVNMVLQQHKTPTQSSVSSDSPTADFGTLINDFSKSKTRSCQIRDGADVAMLFVQSTTSCGMAQSNSFSVGSTLGVVSENCATGYYSFVHELAHMADAHHNMEVNSNAGNNKGEHIKTTSNTASGKRTIMAYNGSGYRERIQYFSSNTVVGNLKMGTPSEDNVSTLNKNAAAMAAVAENNPCDCVDRGYGAYACHQYRLPDSCQYTTFQDACPKTCNIC